MSDKQDKDDMREINKIVSFFMGTPFIFLELIMSNYYSSGP